MVMTLAVFDFKVPVCLSCASCLHVASSENDKKTHRQRYISLTISMNEHVETIFSSVCWNDSNGACELLQLHSINGNRENEFSILDVVAIDAATLFVHID